jgi:hypothetical protein
MEDEVDMSPVTPDVVHCEQQQRKEQQARSTTPCTEEGQAVRREGMALLGIEGQILDTASAVYAEDVEEDLQRQRRLSMEAPRLVCRQFGTPAGCARGSACPFLHAKT